MRDFIVLFLRNLGASLTILLLWAVFLPPSLAQAQGVGLTTLSIDGLTFITYPDFSAIDFTYHKETLQTIDITHEETHDVSLSSYVFADTPTPTDTPTPSPVPTDTPTPTPTLAPSVSPSPTITPTLTPSPALTPTDTPTPSPTPTPVPVVGDDIWDKLAACESHNNWSIDTGNGYFGGLQFSQGAWNSVGGSGKPSDASREQQIEMGKKLQALRGWGAWGECAKKLGLN